jgi:SAM-dependent methyltransferase
VASHSLESGMLSNSGMRFAAFLVAAGLLTCMAEGQSPSPEQIAINTPYVASPPHIVDAMLELANVTGSDTVYDLGCGDGRIVIAAAQEYGARGVGIDINPARIAEARANARDAGVDDRISFQANDLFDADIRSATVVALYLLPEVNLRLRPRLLRELKPGTRVVSHAFDMGDWKPDKEIVVGGERVYLWTIPPRGVPDAAPARRGPVVLPPGSRVRPWWVYVFRAVVPRPASPRQPEGFSPRPIRLSWPMQRDS